MSDVTERYVDAVLGRLLRRQRDDIELELWASIRDAVEDHLDGGSAPEAAEVAALTKPGDPVRLAAGYADRPLQLIGSKLYLDYTRLLTALLVTIVPFVVVTVGVVRALRGDPLLSVVGDTLSVALTAGVHVAFWTTLVFVVIERVPSLHQVKSWTPAELPATPSRRQKYGELVVETVAMVLFTTFILLSPAMSPGPLSPWLWETGVIYVFLAMVAAGLGFSFAKYYARWSVPLAVADALVDVACAVALIWFGVSEKVMNPAFLDAAGWSPDVAQWINVVAIVIGCSTILHTVVEKFGRAHKR